MKPRALQVVLLLAVLLAAGSALSATAHPAQVSRPAAEPEPKVFFDLTVSLEWQPGSADSLPADLIAAGCTSTEAEAAFLSDLESGLKKFGAYLYYYSEGQMALRNATIYTDGQNWESADIRILANSSYRPTAFVGGITKRPLVYTSPQTGQTVIFAPAPILLSRLWDGKGARCGGWSAAAGWRTIGHEWGHYALYLYDGYFNVNTGQPQYCTTTGRTPGVYSDLKGKEDTLMSYHYTADKLWLSGTPPPHSGPPPWTCEDTPQDFVHGVSDWETIKQFYPTLSLPSSPGGTVLGAGPPVTISVVLPATVPASTSAKVKLDPLPAKDLVGLSYLVRTNSDGIPQRILGQGYLLPGEARPLPFWGIQESTKDRASVVIQDWVSGERYAYPKDTSSAAPLSVSAANNLSATTSLWRPSLTISPLVFGSGKVGEISEVAGLRVRLEDCARRTKRVLMAYCPAGGQCSESVFVSAGFDGAFTHTFAFPRNGRDEPPAIHGYIYARSLDTNEETVSWYQIGGGVGPGHVGGFAPLVDGLVNTEQPPATPGPQGDNRMLFAPAQRCTAQGQLPNNILGIVGTSFDVQPIRPNDNGGIGWDTRRQDAPLRVRLNYDQDLLDRLGIGENQLVVLRLRTDRQGLTRWEAVKEAGRNTELDFITAEGQDFDGNGEVFALGYITAPPPPQQRTLLPLVSK